MSDFPRFAPRRASRTTRVAAVAAFLLPMLTLPSPTLADIDPNSGIDFVRIGAVGNAPWQGNGQTGDLGIGRGRVDYEYGMGKFEITTAQWAEFFNAAFDRPAGDSLPFVQAPGSAYWGGVATTPGNAGGHRWMVPGGNHMKPVGSISWRTAAMYCNWLTNNKSFDRTAFLSGAYDVSTFGASPDGGFTDQRTHSPSAKYWIPTLDEWQKAAHYDPNKQNGDGSTGGWWRFSISQDTLPTYGPPGVHVNAHAPIPDPDGPLAQINAGWSSQEFVGLNPFQVALGSYPGVQSPWGLLDTGGATSEWLEEVFGTNSTPSLWRLYQGSSWDGLSISAMDAVNVFATGESPLSFPLFDFGLRLSTSVPPPPMTSLPLLFCVSWLRPTRARDTQHAKHPSSFSFHRCTPDRSDGPFNNDFCTAV